MCILCFPSLLFHRAAGAVTAFCSFHPTFSNLVLICSFIFSIDHDPSTRLFISLVPPKRDFLLVTSSYGHLFSLLMCSLPSNTDQLAIPLSFCLTDCFNEKLFQDGSFGFVIPLLADGFVHKRKFRKQEIFSARLEEVFDTVSRCLRAVASG